MILEIRRTERRNYGNINTAFCSGSDFVYQRFSDCSRPSPTVRETVFFPYYKSGGKKRYTEFSNTLRKLCSVSQSKYAELWIRLPVTLRKSFLHQMRQMNEVLVWIRKTN